MRDDTDNPIARAALDEAVERLCYPVELSSGLGSVMGRSGALIRDNPGGFALCGMLIARIDLEAGEITFMNSHYPDVLESLRAAGFVERDERRAERK